MGAEGKLEALVKRVDGLVKQIKVIALTIAISTVFTVWMFCLLMEHIGLER